MAKRFNRRGGVSQPRRPARPEMEKERGEILGRLEGSLEPVMALLGFIWLLLLVLEFTRGLSPFLQAVSSFIWVLFILDFALKLAIAPSRPAFLRRNVLTLVSLLLPALRVLRAARAVRFVRTVRGARGVRMARVLGTLNRGMRSMAAGMQRRGLGYVLGLTLIVTLGGAAGMYTFESRTHPGFDSFGAALWWTAMLLTSLGSEYWPRSGEGRLLSLLLGIYGFAIFGYVTAAIASMLVGQDIRASRTQGDRKGAAEEAKALRRELERLRGELAALRTGLEKSGGRS